MRALAALVKGSCVDELLTEANAPLLGHALSLLLQVADSEASAGDRGSRTLRAEAFRTLDVLLRQARPRIERIHASDVPLTTARCLRRLAIPTRLRSSCLASALAYALASAKAPPMHLGCARCRRHARFRRASGLTAWLSSHDIAP